MSFGFCDEEDGGDAVRESRKKRVEAGFMVLYGVEGFVFLVGSAAFLCFFLVVCMVFRLAQNDGPQKPKKIDTSNIAFFVRLCF